MAGTQVYLPLARIVGSLTWKGDTLHVPAQPA